MNHVLAAHQLTECKLVRFNIFECIIIIIIIIIHFILCVYNWQQQSDKSYIGPTHHSLNSLVAQSEKCPFELWVNDQLDAQLRYIRRLLL